MSTIQQLAFPQPLPPSGQLIEMSASAASIASGVYPGSSVSAFKMKNTTITPATLPNLPSSNDHITINIIIITIIFCMVCFLLLAAFFYAFYFQCMLQPSPKDCRKDTSGSVDREDATFRRTSSSVSLGNAVWNELDILSVTGFINTSSHWTMDQHSTCLLEDIRELTWTISNLYGLGTHVSFLFKASYSNQIIM